MKLILHIVRKDFLRLRWGLVGWWVVIGLKLAIGFALILFVGGAQWAEMGHASAIWSDRTLAPTLFTLTTIERLLAFLLTAMLVQEDGLVGTKQFWVTRPISPGRLLTAKLVGWLLMLWLSAVVLTLPWWLTCGFGVREIAWAALELLALQMAASLPAAVVAALTDTLSRVVVWSLVLVAFVSLAVPMAMAALVMRGTVTSASASPFASLSVLGVVLTGAVVIARQYWRRNWVSSLNWLGVGVIVAPVALALVAVQFSAGLQRIFSGQGPEPDWRVERAQGISLRQHSYYTGPRAPRSELIEQSLNTYLAATGVPRGLMLMQGTQARQAWRWPNGLVVERNASWVNAPGNQAVLRLATGVSKPKRDEETERYNQKLQEERERRQSKQYLDRVRSVRTVLREEPIGAMVSAMVLPSTVERMKQTPPSYEATVQLRLVQPEPWIEIPYATSGWHAYAGYGIRLGARFPRDRAEARRSKLYDPAYDEVPGTVAFPIVATMPYSLWNTMFSQVYWMRDRWKEPGLFVINRAGGDLMSQNVLRTPRLTLAGVGIVSDVARAWTPVVRRGDNWVERDPHWLEGAKFVLVGVREEARFTREVKAERFLLDP